MVAGPLFAYKQLISTMDLKQMKSELSRKQTHNAKTGFTQSKIWVLENLIKKKEEQRIAKYKNTTNEELIMLLGEEYLKGLVENDLISELADIICSRIKNGMLDTKDEAIKNLMEMYKFTF